MYYLITDSFRKQEAKLVELIKQVAPAERIYMLGSSLVQERIESVFTTEAPTKRSVGHYWFLVLVAKTNDSNSRIQDRIENTCHSLMPITAIVLQSHLFNTWLAGGRCFATTVERIAVKLYDDGNSAPYPNIEEQPCLDAPDSKHMVNEFLAGAKLYSDRQANSMAAFMLHQATEHALHGIFKKYTGLHINTHNLDKLLRYCSMVNGRVNEIFPTNTPDAERQFNLLQKAYIDSRYKKELTIGSGDVAALIDKVTALQQLMLHAIE